ncbi:sulfurtransferase [Williamsoniiplasma somnilux]|uniref:Sulfurtransferase n=1 Tax=Williamsoniiplasma somnilux TaxID=215578 RepID=A0A2K8P0U5_9MOLU|nr:rhodanese-like domain-containing protein [Williamsoniiplasma somnilux]ATZ19058.1 sulfurtransferase [Williamsoniiplasma somnilux]
MKDFVSNKDFKKMIKNGWIAVDVRTVYELSFLTKIQEAINCPYPDIIKNMDKLFPDKDSKLIFFCNAGNRSGLVARTYRHQGYKNAYFLQNGIEGLENNF